MRKVLVLSVTLLGGCDDTVRSEIRALADDSADRVFFFFDVNCRDCSHVKNDLLSPLLEKSGIPRAEVVYLDVGKPQTLELLARLEASVGFEATVLAPVVVIGHRAYCGIDEVEQALTREDPIQ